MPQKLKDWTGQKRGALLVLGRGENNILNQAQWNCICDCGRSVLIPSGNLSQSTSCGCGIHRHAKRVIDLVGHRFGRLTVLKRIETPNLCKPTGWLCKCDCGNECAVITYNLRSGTTQSCGCLQLEKTRTHGYSRLPGTGKKTPTYRSWQSMIARCSNPSCFGFEHYQKKGITVCERWKKFENFLADMGKRPTNKTLERKDNSKGYEPDNCKWATKLEQANNRETNRRFTYRGEEYSLSQLARHTGASRSMLRGRLILSTGWTVEGAVHTPRIPNSKSRQRIRA
jgi:hypothetical protein